MELSERVWNENEIRYAINQACGCSPITIMFRLIFSGRIWLQNRVIDSLKDKNIFRYSIKNRRR